MSVRWYSLDLPVLFLNWLQLIATIVLYANYIHQVKSMDSEKFYEELKLYRGEDRAKLLMQQVRCILNENQHQKWWQKISLFKKPKTEPKGWE